MIKLLIINFELLIIIKYNFKYHSKIIIVFYYWLETFSTFITYPLSYWRR